MAKRKVVGQTGNRNLSKIDRSSWGRNKKVMKTITGKTKGQSEFLHSSGVNAVMKKLQQQTKRGTQVLRHTGFSQGNLAGARISSVKGNRKVKNVELVMGVPGTQQAIVYDFGRRATKDVKGWLTGSKALFNDKQYAKVMKQAGLKVHGSLTLANKTMGLQIGKNGTKLGTDYVTAQYYDQNGNLVKVKPGARKSAGKKPAYGKQSTNIKTPKVGVETVSNVAPQPKMSDQQFRNVEFDNITPEQWGQMSSGQKFLTIARMSSPAFKADKANKYAKKMETKAKNISRGIGIAGKTIGGIGRGISSGYSRGWGSR